MNSLLLSCIICSLLLVDSAYSAASLKAVGQDGVKLATFALGRTLEVKCNATTGDRGEDKKLEVEWKKDGVPIEEIETLKDRFKTSKDGSIHKLIIRDSKEEDIGNYSCTLDNGDLQEEIPVFVRPTLKLPTNINVVEEEKLKIPCQVHGKPFSEVSWYYANETMNQTDIFDLMDTNERITLEEDEQKIPNSVLVIKNIQMWERGEYTCVGQPPYGHRKVNSTTMVRIKDKYAALWPFLGICAEAFVLCAIILIYEKKRNKAELDESDTDQSPDQKNTPDHNKDSNLRHRQ